MSRLFTKFYKFFRSKTLVGIDKAGNRYFTRKEEVDGILKDKRWVIFKGEQDPTSIPVEWICWLNGQRKKAPTPEEMMELESMREQVKQNVALLKKEEEERLKNSGRHPTRKIGKDASPDLNSFIKQFPSASYEKIEGDEEPSNAMDDDRHEERSSEPTGSGSSFKPGTWQPPT
ncbi:hypothetical protein HPP92_003677 [Vanilla planifolia]|uniref:NADH dehydrogenase [ubiquinone] 1 alpha subcomplex subunit 12 n=1 Tax=Vanilla planifolia TaxID=51239 RepID=A0A835VNI0_VANPL|nr:hypothetical protein HPP92_004131 [Vanilla planifolia]KAG0503605.1 hypothetical protein HPP92_003677 [Vanilla planifolia]